MATRYVRAQSQMGRVGTTRYVMVPTSPAQLLTLNSGYQALELFVVGTGNLIWGDSNIAVNSGNYLWVGMNKIWDNLQDGWTVYLRADSIQTLVSISEKYV